MHELTVFRVKKKSHFNDIRITTTVVKMNSFKNLASNPSLLIIISDSDIPKYWLSVKSKSSHYPFIDEIYFLSSK